MSVLPDQVDLAAIAYLQHQLDDEKEIQARVVKARELDEGYLDDDLATRLQTWLIGGSEAELEAINLCLIALNTVAGRISVQGITSPDEGLQEWLQAVWRKAKLHIMQRELHRRALRDGESFLLVDYDPERPSPLDRTALTGAPKFYVQSRFTDTEVSWKELNGDGEGCKAHYLNDDINQDLLMVSKRWIETTYEDDEPVTAQRMTLYIAGQLETAARIEKFILNDAGEWDQHQDESDQGWPIWWTDNGSQAGASLPIPVFHFKGVRVDPLTRPIWGLQNAMDHAFSSFLGGNQMAGFQMLVALGFYPTTDGAVPNDAGTNLMEVGPRRIIGTAQKGPGEASLTAVNPGDIKQLMDALDKIATFASFVLGLPIANFVFSKNIASGETLRQGEAELMARANDLMDLFEVEWEAALSAVALLDTVFGSASWDESAEILVNWSPVETRNTENRILESSGKFNSRVPAQVIWADVWGYSPDEIDQMLLMVDTATNEDAPSESSVTTPAGAAAQAPADVDGDEDVLSS